jgi:hypothetical protein
MDKSGFVPKYPQYNSEEKKLARYIDYNQCADYRYDIG